MRRRFVLSLEDGIGLFVAAKTSKFLVAFSCSWLDTNECRRLKEEEESRDILLALETAGVLVSINPND